MHFNIEKTLQPSITGEFIMWIPGMNALDSLLLTNEVILPLWLKSVCEASAALPSTWHYTLQSHAANLELFPWVLKKRSSWFFELETKLVHAAHSEKGEVLVRSKPTKWSFFFFSPNRREKQNKTSQAAVLRHTGSVILKACCGPSIIFTRLSDVFIFVYLTSNHQREQQGE